MATVKFVEESEAAPEMRAIFQEIKQTFGLPSVPNLFRAMAHNPVYLSGLNKFLDGLRVESDLRP